MRLLRTVKPQLYIRIKQSAGLKYIVYKSIHIAVNILNSKITVHYSRNAVR